MGAIFFTAELDSAVLAHMKLIQTTDRIFHVYNRGVDKRDIFLNGKDYNRFLLSILAFNNANVRYPQSISNHWVTIDPGTKHHVEILCFCLMPNHYHLVLQELEPDGMSIFMQRIGTGYTNYFNHKNKRSGSLLQGNYKAKPVTNDRYLLNLSTYIHLNPLPLLNLSETSTPNQTIEKLKQYPWSSFPDYLQNRSSFLNPKRIMKNFESPNDYSKFIKSWITHILPINKAPTAESNSAVTTKHLQRSPTPLLRK